MLIYILHSAGEDYQIDSITIGVAARLNSKSFTVNINTDDFTECDEIFKLTLSVPASTCGVVSRKPDTTEVTIKDHSRKTVSDHVALFMYNQQECCFHLINHTILLKKTVLHCWLV